MRGRIFENSTEIKGINVTPVIDVALTLVIILLITAPVLSISDAEVNLPQARSRTGEDGGKLSISLNVRGELRVGKTAVTRDRLAETIRDIVTRPGGEGLLVVLRADEGVPYGTIREILEEARKAGAERLAIATTHAGKGIQWKPAL